MVGDDGWWTHGGGHMGLGLKLEVQRTGEDIRRPL